MSNRLLERRLRGIARRMAQVREEIAVADEQLEHFTTDADDARIRALVSETPISDVEHRQAERHAAAMARHREELIETLARLEGEQDALLDKLSARKG
jgi:hypothetical protein